MTRCPLCFHMLDYCVCPSHQQVNDRRIAVEAMKNYRSGLIVAGGMYGEPIHPDHYKWWKSVGQPSPRKLSDLLSEWNGIVRDYIEKYGEETDE